MSINKGSKQHQQAGEAKLISLKLKEIVSI